LLVVADGMGGHRGGATASRLAVESFGASLAGLAEDASGWLSEAVSTANSLIHERSREDPELRGMGTTVVALLVDPSGATHVAHVGDSRAYRLRGDDIERLTRDHSVVAEMVRRGLITEEEAVVHPRRNEILRSVGVESQVVAELREIDIEPGDRLLLCSDGLSGVVDDAEIASVLMNQEPEPAVKMLIDLANERGGPDNITIAVAYVPAAATTEVTAEVRIAGTGSPAVAPAEGAASSSGVAPVALVVLGALVAALLVYSWILWE
jgi:protein phosphatase